MGILTRRNIRKARGLYPRPPCGLQGGFFLRGGTATAGRRATDGQATQPAIGCIECCERRKRDTGMLAGQGVRDEKPHVR